MARKSTHELEDNGHWQEFLSYLDKKKVSVRRLWSANNGSFDKDTKTPFKYDNVHCFYLVWSDGGVVAIVVDYGARDGFGFFVDQPCNQYDEMVKDLFDRYSRK